MTKTNPVLKRIAYLLSALVIAVVPVVSATQTSAAQITARKVILGTSLANTSTSYAFTFTVPTTGTIVKSVSMVPCTTASGACSTPGSWSGTGATASQPSSAGLGDTTGWSTTDSTATELRLSKTGNAATPAATTPVTVTFSSVNNPLATNSTFFLRITTFANANWTSVLDTGTVAASTAGQIVVNATVDETLTFTLAGSTVTLSNPTTSATGTGTSTMTAATNASSGYSITVAGSTLTGPSTITAMTGATGNASATNSKQFGLNLKANTTPSVGTNVTGTGSGVPTAASGYDVADFFKFVSGNTIAGATGPTNSNTYTVSYVANIDGSTLPGAYTTTLTYVATPNF